MALREQGLSRRKIAEARHMPMDSVCEACDIAEECHITWAQVVGL